jgi:hypothetical protein
MNLHENCLIWLIFGVFGGMWTLTVVGYICYCQGRKVGTLEKESKNHKFLSRLINSQSPDMDPVIPTSNSKEEGRR